MNNLIKDDIYGEDFIATREAQGNISGLVHLKTGEEIEVSLKDLPDFLDRHGDQIQL